MPQKAGDSGKGARTSVAGEATLASMHQTQVILKDLQGNDAPADRTLLRPSAVMVGGDSVGGHHHCSRSREGTSVAPEAGNLFQLVNCWSIAGVLSLVSLLRPFAPVVVRRGLLLQVLVVGILLQVLRIQLVLLLLKEKLQVLTGVLVVVGILWILLVTSLATRTTTMMAISYRSLGVRVGSPSS